MLLSEAPGEGGEEVFGEVGFGHRFDRVVAFGSDHPTGYDEDGDDGEIGRQDGHLFEVFFEPVGVGHGLVDGVVFDAPGEAEDAAVVRDLVFGLVPLGFAFGAGFGFDNDDSRRADDDVVDVPGAVPGDVVEGGEAGGGEVGTGEGFGDGLFAAEAELMVAEFDEGFLRVGKGSDEPAEDGDGEKNRDEEDGGVRVGPEFRESEASDQQARDDGEEADDAKAEAGSGCECLHELDGQLLVEL